MQIMVYRLRQLHPRHHCPRIQRVEGEEEEVRFCRGGQLSASCIFHNKSDSSGVAFIILMKQFPWIILFLFCEQPLLLLLVHVPKYEQPSSLISLILLLHIYPGFYFPGVFSPRKPDYFGVCSNVLDNNARNIRLQKQQPSPCGR